MTYKLIACDLDETLLDRNHQIPQSNIAAIKRAREEFGVKFVPATGRGYASVQNTLKELGLIGLTEEYVLSFNGGALTENKNNKLLQFKGLPYPKALELFEFGLTKDVCIHVYTQEELYVFNISDSEQARFDSDTMIYQLKESHSLAFLQDQPIAKVLFQNIDSDYLHQLEPEMAAITEGCVEVSYSSNRYMEFNALGIDKGQGLIDLAKTLGIPMSQTIAVGDNYNDLAMLKVAGLSVAASNAVPAVKEICDYVTVQDHHEGVVAELLERFVFNP